MLSDHSTNNIVLSKLGNRQIRMLLKRIRMLLKRKAGELTVVQQLIHQIETKNVIFSSKQAQCLKTLRWGLGAERQSGPIVDLSTWFLFLL